MAETQGLVLGTMRQAARACPLPELSEDACARRYSLLIRRGLLGPGIACRVGGRLFLNLGQLRRWLAAGGSLATPTEPEQEVQGAS